MHWKRKSNQQSIKWSTTICIHLSWPRACLLPWSGLWRTPPEGSRFNFKLSGSKPSKGNPFISISNWVALLSYLHLINSIYFLLSSLLFFNICNCMRWFAPKDFLTIVSFKLMKLNFLTVVWDGLLLKTFWLLLSYEMLSARSWNSDINQSIRGLVVLWTCSFKSRHIIQYKNWKIVSNRLSLCWNTKTTAHVQWFGIHLRLSFVLTFPVDFVRSLVSSLRLEFTHQWHDRIII